ncbi:adenylyltransferase/cytidyltransferase family protein [Alkalihalobacillus sp. BA299]|uniref:adenylyltransferase/cytidyltransferase family protein n=1 Tax=Alkalihalobacillus sp. BA299 TaxID=2815938 RepID=UPI001ADBCAAF|nr:adenylyltransferase/cytidyltransferase family protein [Alkalihalobacillus sp. BA299]
MKTIIVNEKTLPQAYEQATDCVMALGYFDGVHLGHQKVIEVAREEARRRGLPLAVMSFRPHPIKILSGGKKQVAHLMTLCDKESALQRQGVDLFYLVEFTLGFAGLSPKQFVDDYLVRLNVKHAVAGFDFNYGVKGSGKLKDIPSDSNGGIMITEVDCVDYLGEKISSTAIRQRIVEGLVDEVPHFLGKYYKLKAHWDGISFQPLEQTLFPKEGVYKVEIQQLNSSYLTMMEITSDLQLIAHDFSSILKKGNVIIKLLKYSSSSLPIYSKVSF